MGRRVGVVEVDVDVEDEVVVRRDVVVVLAPVV